MMSLFGHFSLIYNVGAILCEKYACSAKELVGKVEAFLTNSNKSVLSLDTIGKIEVLLVQAVQQVNYIYLVVTVLIDEFINFFLVAQKAKI
jgi:hypothetical protein